MNTICEQINSMGQTFVRFAWPMLIQSCGAIAVLLLADFLLRKRMRAVLRYWLWMLLFVALLMPTSPLSRIGARQGVVSDSTCVNLAKAGALSQDSRICRIADGPARCQVGSAGSLRGVAQALAPSLGALFAAPAVQSPLPLSWQGAVFAAWLSAVLAIIVVLVARVFVVWRLVSSARQANGFMTDVLKYCCKHMGITQHVGLRVSVKITSPLVCGLLRPVILLPHDLAPTLGSRHLRAVLLHELAHIKRADLWVNLAQTVLQIVYFYNPLLWLANAAIRRVRDQAVDETVLATMGQKVCWYPQTLAGVAGFASEPAAFGLDLISVG